MQNFKRIAAVAVIMLVGLATLASAQDADSINPACSLIEATSGESAMGEPLSLWERGLSAAGAILPFARAGKAADVAVDAQGFEGGVSCLK